MTLQIVSGNNGDPAGPSGSSRILTSPAQTPQPHLSSSKSPRARLATVGIGGKRPVAPGTPTLATSVVTVVGSMSHMHLDGSYDDIPEESIVDSGNSNEGTSNDNKVKTSPRHLAVMHNTNNGLPSPPNTIEERDNADLSLILPAVTTKTATTAAAATASANSSNSTNTSKAGALPPGPSVPMRRSIVVGGRKGGRRKRGAAIPSAAATAAAAAAAQQAVAAATATTKAAEKVPTPPPSPKQQPLQSPAPAPLTQPTKDQNSRTRSPQRQPLPEATGNPPRNLQQQQLFLQLLANQQKQPEFFDQAARNRILREALSPQNELLPVAQRPKRIIQRMRIKATTIEESDHLHARRCARPPIMSCSNPAVEDGMYCLLHTCKGINEDSTNCRAIAYNPVEEDRYCVTGFHRETGEGIGQFLAQYQTIGHLNAEAAEQARLAEREEMLAMFEEKFGQCLSVPLSSPAGETAAQSQLQPQAEASPQSNSPSTALSSASPTPVNSLESSPPNHRYVPFDRPKALWGSSYVDKWWQGEWQYRVPIPLELQVRADYHHYRRSSRIQPSYTTSEFSEVSRPTSPTLPLAPAPKDPMAMSLISDYGGRLNVSTRWQGTSRPSTLRRYSTA